MARRVILAATAAACLFTAEAFVPSSVGQLPALRRDGSASCSVEMNMDGKMDRRAAILTTLFTIPAVASRPVDAAGFSLLPPALQQAAKSAKKKKGEEVEEEAPAPAPAPAPEVEAEAAPPPPPVKKEIKKKRGGLASMMPEKKAAPAPAPKEEVAAGAEAEAAPAPKKSSVRGFKFGRKADGEAKKDEDAVPAAKIGINDFAPKFEKDPLVRKQQVAGATGKERFDTKVTMSLEEKLKARAAKTDAQYEAMKGQTVPKDDEAPRK
eukprot:CAMPEP_0177718200 /NCGR_PEP_ID=MMETSP0484_2-20121128/15452_1 /TAXON_ID=354590 /ORGANISM="Rhodomonas lens, Strain RHODO" /LENGTH=265 /DNA_ID=CAMNT_0019230353 /DNA_START=14 /DNA_END=811 /DNA_ORIENTATION=+